MKKIFITTLAVSLFPSIKDDNQTENLIETTNPTIVLTFIGSTIVDFNGTGANA